LVRTTGDEFSQVADSTGKIVSLISEITTASNEQAIGIGEVNRALSELDHIMQSVVDSSETSAMVADKMNNQTEQVSSSIAALQSLISGNARNKSPRPTQRHRNPEGGQNALCWELKNCPSERRDACPAYPSNGERCWEVTGTKCGGQTQGSFHQKIARCRECDLFKTNSGSANGHKQLPVAA